MGQQVDQIAVVRHFAHVQMRPAVREVLVRVLGQVDNGWAELRPQALRDQQGEVRYYRKEGGSRVAVKAAKATNAALDQIELDPGIGSPTLGKRLGIPGLRTWRVAKFPLLCATSSAQTTWMWSD